MFDVVVLGHHKRCAMTFQGETLPAIRVHHINPGWHGMSSQQPRHQLDSVTEPLHYGLVTGFLKPSCQSLDKNIAAAIVRDESHVEIPNWACTLCITPGN